MRFFGATQDYAGLGFTVRLQEEGHQVLLSTNSGKTEIADPEVCRRYQRVGEGIVEKVPLHSVDENETLRAEGFRVLGGGRHAYTVEHDRKACLDFVGRHGLEAPPSLDFERPSDAIISCAHHAGTAYGYKSDSGLNFQTFLPESEDPAKANHKLEMYLRSLIENETANQSFLLQERKEALKPM
jgi:hypothetical protein